MVAQRLGLKSSEGFSLFVKITDKGKLCLSHVVSLVTIVYQCYIPDLLVSFRIEFRFLELGVNKLYVYSHQRS